MKIVKSNEEFAKLAISVAKERNDSIPAAYAIESVEAKEVKLPTEKDEFNRYQLNIAGQQLRASLFRGTPENLPAYDLAMCRSTREVKVSGTDIVYPTGTPSWRLVAPQA